MNLRTSILSLSLVFVLAGGTIALVQMYLPSEAGVAPQPVSATDPESRALSSPHPEAPTVVGPLDELIRLPVDRPISIETLQSRIDNQSETYLLRAWENGPAVEFYVVYEQDGSSGERERIDRDAVYANWVSVRLKYGTNPSAVIAKAEAMGASLLARPGSAGEDYIFGFPNPHIGGSAQAQAAFHDLHPNIVHSRPVWVKDAQLMELMETKVFQ